MSHTIEPAKSGRAKCRKCREKIDKGDLRFGHALASQFSDEPAYQWYHLKCAAEKVAADLATTLSTYTGDIPDRAEIDELISQNRRKQKPTTFPYADIASSARSSCQVCETKIEKGEFRVAIEREIDAGGFTRMGAGYLHVNCAREYEDTPDDLVDEIRRNSISLEESEIDDVVQQLDAADT